MINCLWVGLGGFVGSVLRYLLGLIHLSEKTQFPLMTMLINVAGALAIGIIVGLTEKFSGLSPQVILFLKVGVCGGFTTFSTFALETSQLFSAGKTTLGLVYIVLSVVLCVLAVLLGRSLVKA
jgi:CrcB protein